MKDSGDIPVWVWVILAASVSVLAFGPALIIAVKGCLGGLQ